MPSSARYAVIRSSGRIRTVSTKLGIVWIVVARAAGTFAATLARRSSDSTVTASARR